MAKKVGGTPATTALTKAGVDFTVHSYEHSASESSWGLEAAQELALPPERVFKTLMVMVDQRLCVAIVPVAGTLDLKAAAKALSGKKAELADPALAQRATGYVVGGISPIGQRKAHPTALDESALAFDTVFVSGGKRGMDIELAPSELVTITSAVVARIRTI